MIDNGIAGPHPDMRELACYNANTTAEYSRKDGRDFTWPSRPFTPEDLTIVGQRTWHNAPSIYLSMDGGSLTVALIEARVEGHRYGGMIEAVINPGKEDWGLLSGGFGERPEGRPLGGDSGGAGRRYVGLQVSESGVLSNVHAIEIEYIDGTINRAEAGDDGCIILFSSAPGWDEAEAEITARYVDASNNTIQSHTIAFSPGPRPTDDAAG